MLKLCIFALFLGVILAQEEDLPAVPPPFKALEQLCGNNIAPIACACASGGTFPNQQNDLVKCNPTECRCEFKFAIRMAKIILIFYRSWQTMGKIHHFWLC